MRKRNNAMWGIMSAIMILSMLASIASFVLSINHVSKENSENDSVVIASMVSQSIVNKFLRPITVAETMSKDYDLRKRLKTGDKSSAKDVEKDIAAYLESIRKGFGYQMVFAVSDVTKAYHTYNGIAKYLQVDVDEHDIWYKNFKESGKHYELNVDTDEVNNWDLSVFVNTEIKDEKGNFLGVCGTGVEMTELQLMLLQYEQKYDIKINLMDRNGLVQLDTDGEKIEQSQLEHSYLSEIQPGQFYYQRLKDTSRVTQYMEDLDWYLVVEDYNPNKIDVRQVVTPSIIIFCLGLIAMGMTLLISSYRERKLHKASEEKDRFLANMSHEIRTPINAVLGMNTMILRECNDQKIREYAQRSQNAGRTLLSIINDILDISKIESGKMEIVPMEYELTSLIQDAVSMVMVKADAKKLSVDLQIDETLPTGLYGDDVRIRQVLVNLLNNAVKYTEKGGIVFSVSGTRNGDDILLHFSVKDTGIGIKQSDMEKLFKAFERIEESRNHNVEGTGLGMSIAIQLLSLMGSQIQVESVYGEGSEFYFDLHQEIRDDNEIGDYAARLEEERESYSYEVSFVAPDAKVLVVDDNATNRDVFVELLKETKVKIDQAAGGREALQMLYEQRYDVVFLDHMMPDMDGIEVVKELKNNQEHPNVNTPIIVLTANAIAGAKEQYLKAGFDNYLSKPIIPEKMEKMLVDYLPEDKVQIGEKRLHEESEIEKDTIDQLPMIDGVNWQYALLHLGRKNAIIKTVQSFYQTIEIEADELANWYQRIINDDAEAMQQFRIKVHAMKSSAMVIGAFSLAGTAAMLEFAARDENKELIVETTPYFIENWRAFRYCLKELKRTPEEKHELTLRDSEEVLDYLEQIVEAAAVFDVQSADAAMDALQKYEYPEEVEGMLERLAGAISNLDVDKMERIASELMDKIHEIY